MRYIYIYIFMLWRNRKPHITLMLLKSRTRAINNCRHRIVRRHTITHLPARWIQCLHTMLWFFQHHNFLWWARSALYGAYRRHWPAFHVSNLFYTMVDRGVLQTKRICGVSAVSKSVLLWASNIFLKIVIHYHYHLLKLWYIMLFGCVLFEGNYSSIIRSRLVSSYILNAYKYNKSEIRHVSVC